MAHVKKGNISRNYLHSMMPKKRGNDMMRRRAKKAAKFRCQIRKCMLYINTLCIVSEKIESDCKKKNKVFLALNKRKCTTPQTFVITYLVYVSSISSDTRAKY